MSQEPGISPPHVPAEPPLTVASWAVLAVVWTAGLISWGVWVLLAGYILWRLFGGSDQAS